MTITRRHVLAGAIAAPALIGGARRGSAATRIIKISHQFPGGTETEGDFRDRLCRKFGLDDKIDGTALVNEIFGKNSTHLPELSLSASSRLPARPSRAGRPPQSPKAEPAASSRSATFISIRSSRPVL